MRSLAKLNSTYISYIIENGLENMLEQDDNLCITKTRPENNTYINTTMNSELVTTVRAIAKSKKVKLGDVVLHCLNFIDYDGVKRTNHWSSLNIV